MPDKTFKHFILSRFFINQSAKYPHDVLDTDFLSTQLPLAKNMLSSLENQTNQNFELIFVLHPNFFVDPKYEFIFSTLKDSTKLPLKFMRTASKFYLHKPKLTDPKLKGELFDLIKDATDNYDFVITTKMDFDDFIHKNAVREAQNKIDECDNLLLHGYNKGYQYISTSHELYTHFDLWKEIGHHSIFQSLIVASSFAKKLPCFTVENFGHNRAKSELKEFLEINGVEFSENMFQQNDYMNAYIYFRHNSSWTISIGHGGKARQSVNAKKLTAEDITKKQLEEEFGFFYDLKSIK